MQEVIEVLHGRGEERLRELSLTLASYMVLGAKKAVTLEEARALLEETITSGVALKKLAEFVARQGGNAEQVKDPSLLEIAAEQKDVTLPASGYLASCVTKEVGMASLLLGGGRETKESEIDLSVGIVLHKKLGDYVKESEPVATIYGNDKKKIEAAAARLRAAYTVTTEKPVVRPLIYDVITKDSF